MKWVEAYQYRHQYAAYSLLSCSPFWVQTLPSSSCFSEIWISHLWELLQRLGVFVVLQTYCSIFVWKQIMYASILQPELVALVLPGIVIIAALHASFYCTKYRHWISTTQQSISYLGIPLWPCFGMGHFSFYCVGDLARADGLPGILSGNLHLAMLVLLSSKIGSIPKFWGA